MLVSLGFFIMLLGFSKLFIELKIYANILDKINTIPNVK